MPTPTPTAPTDTRRRPPFGRTIAAVSIMLGAALGVVAIVMLWLPSTSTATALRWPETGSAAVMIGDQVEHSTDGESRPMASITKLVTVLVTLEHLPDEAIDSGMPLSLTPADVQRAAASVADGGTGVPLVADEPLNVRQYLDHILVSSSNVHAVALVNRVFGSEQTYLTAARAWLDEHGLSQIVVADASGLSPDNRGTATALLRLGKIAAEHPEVSEIARQPGFVTPAGFMVQATNDLLGVQGIDGLKTGFTDAAGYTMLFTTTTGPDGSGTRVIGVVLGAPSETQRASDVTRLIASVRAHFAD